MMALKRLTASAGPPAYCQTPDETARKSAPDSINAWQLSMVIPPIATQGISKTSLHHLRISSVARLLGCLVAVSKKAPKAT